MGIDVVGDIHGHAVELKALLQKLGYRRHGAGFRHPDRQVAFVGDFVDRGPAIAEVLEVVRAMVDAGDAVAVMGNHEYNAIAFHTLIPGKRETWFREHSEKNLKQHRATLDQLSAQELAEAVDWFRTLPVAFEIEGLRIVHAAWCEWRIETLHAAADRLGRFTSEFLAESERRDSQLHAAVEYVLKGPELKLPPGFFMIDKEGHSHEAIRIRWFENGSGRTYAQHHLGSGDVPDVVIKAKDLDGFVPYPSDAPPVLAGHYWLTGTPAPLATNVACTDYSVAKQGKLVAYRWDGESVLEAEKFDWVGSGKG